MEYIAAIVDDRQFGKVVGCNTFEQAVDAAVNLVKEVLKRDLGKEEDFDIRGEINENLFYEVDNNHNVCIGQVE